MPELCGLPDIAHAIAMFTVSIQSINRSVDVNRTMSFVRILGNKDFEGKTFSRKAWICMGFCVTQNSSHELCLCLTEMSHSHMVACLRVCKREKWF